MSDWTPTTGEVRRKFARASGGYGLSAERAAFQRIASEHTFDRWLAQVKAEAWDEGYRTCDAVWAETADIVTPDEYRTDPSNPYREAAQ